MKKKLICLVLIVSGWLLPSYAFATESNTDIPEMTIEQLIVTMQAKQAKVDIIKKNNEQIKNLKEELKNRLWQ